jgi:type IV pilus assembly protein PilN
MINLLPWRDDLRKKRKQQFFIILFVSALLAIIIILIWCVILKYKIKQQKIEMVHIKQQIHDLSYKCLQVTKLQQERQNLVKRTKDIEALQNKNKRNISLFNELAEIVPSGVYLTEFTKDGNKIVLIGEARLHTDIVALVENVNQSEWLTKPTLQEVKLHNSDKNKFILKCLLNL